MDQRKLSTSANLLRLSTLGINFALSIFAGLFIGWGINKLFHWGSWVIMAGMVLGIVSSYVLLFEDLKTLNSPSNNKSDETKS
jgi:F0F1-type ATP synthase assembly protein I